MDFKNLVICDTECYPNYFLIMFKKVSSGDIIYFEKFNDSELTKTSILNILNKYTIVTFNGIKYDQLMLEAAAAGFNNKSLKRVNDFMIPGKTQKGEKRPPQMQPWQVRKQFGFPKLNFNQIDLIEIAPGMSNLKIYGGRLLSPKLADLPISPNTALDASQVVDLRRYCENDLDVTELLLRSLGNEITLRVGMSEKYGVDLRSKSDAQIAEAVMVAELKNKYGITASKNNIDVGTQYYYKPPSYVSFQSDVLNELLNQYKNLPATITKTGHLDFKFSDGKPKFTFKIGEMTYNAGIGGLHSTEKSTRHTNEGYLLRDYDVASYYPTTILNNKLYPKHLGEEVLWVYESIVQQRLRDKKVGKGQDLKIVINGAFGKSSEKYSVLYQPDLLMNITVTGQLSLLMLIETLESSGVTVVSSNTDGLVLKFKPELEKTVSDIVMEWEFNTGYTLESSDYASLNSRDVNNYIAVKTDGKIKAIGAYADRSDPFYKLRKNPASDICTEAVRQFLANATPIECTIKTCKDITQFLSLRTVNGGASKGGVNFGKSIRWYYGKYELDAIYYQTNGNKVPKSEGGVAMLDLVDNFPDDLDYEYYVKSSYKELKLLGWK